MPSYYRFVVSMLEVVIPSKSHSPPVDDTMSSIIFDSSSKDTDVISSTPMSQRSMLPESWIPPETNLVNLMSKDKGEDVDEDTSIEEDFSMDKEDPVTELELLKEDSSQDSSDESYYLTILLLFGYS